MFIESTPSFLNLSTKEAVQLNPISLQFTIPAYKRFKNLDPSQTVFTKQLPLVSNLSSKKIILALSGLSAVGKDSVRKELERLYPETFCKLVTATTRNIRADETHAKDYYFYENSEVFLEEVRAGKFIEYAEVHPGIMYGLPTYSLEDALSNQAPIVITHTEISGWKQLKRVAAALHIPVVTAFLLPNISFAEYAVWLQTQRPNDYQDRLDRTMWELVKAPKHADTIILNTFNPERAAEVTKETAQRIAALFNI